MRSTVQFCIFYEFCVYILCIQCLSESHTLITARRIEDMNPGEYKSTRSSKQPVVIEGNWQEPSVEEQMKHDTVHKLEVRS